MIIRAILVAVLAVVSSVETSAQLKPERVVMLYVDGLNPDAIDHFGLTEMADLRNKGASAREGVMPFPAHPTIGAYGDWHYTSFPNVMTLAGTAFLKERPTYLQHRFAADGITLHAAGSSSYRSLNDGFHYVLTRGDISDAALIDFYIQAFEREGDILFARIMLQKTGEAGRLQSAENISDDPWSQDIFADGSPYGAAIREADRQIGRLVSFLQSQGKLESTLFVLLGDGQSRSGWHLDLDPESARTPIVFTGPGVVSGKVIDHAETIDVAPTISALMDVDPPNADGGRGVVLTSMFENGAPLDHPQTIARLNEQIRSYAALHASAVLRAMDDPAVNVLLMHLTHELLSEHQFMGPDRVMEWQQAGTLEKLIEGNAWVLQTLSEALEHRRFPFSTDGSKITLSER